VNPDSAERNVRLKAVCGSYMSIDWEVTIDIWLIVGEGSIK
jgi:hypothetical protein